MDEQKIRDLIDSNEITRRRFVGMSTAAAVLSAGGLQLFLTACSAASTSTAKTAAKVVVAVPSLGSENWAPWVASGDEEILTHIVGDTLLRNDPKTRALQAGLATVWDLSADGLTWTFKLRPNVPFHGNYGTLTADDVRFSWDQFIRKDSTQGFAPVYRQAVGGDISGFEVLGPLDFKLHAKNPVVTLAAALSDGTVGLPIQSKKYWDAVSEAQASANPIGTGPYKYIAHQSGVSVTLQAVSSHFRKTPNFKQLILKIISDDSTRLAQVQSGDVDLAPIPLGLRAEAEANKLQIASIPSIGISNMYLGGQYPGHPNIYDSKSPWIQEANPDQGLAIRQALSYAIDRKTILTKVLFGTGQLTAAPIAYPPGLHFDDPSWKAPTYDVSKAKAALAKGGYPNGFSLNMPLFNPPGRPSSSAIGEAVAGMWEAIGIKVNRQPIDFQPTMRGKLVARATAGLAWQWTAPFYDEPLDALHISYVPSGASANFYDPDISAAVSQMSSEPSQAKRYAVARDLGAKLIADVRAIPLFTVGSATAVGKQVKSWVFVNGNATFHNPEYLTP